MLYAFNSFPTNYDLKDIFCEGILRWVELADSSKICVGLTGYVKMFKIHVLVFKQCNDIFYTLKTV